MSSDMMIGNKKRYEKLRNIRLRLDNFYDELADFRMNCEDKTKYKSLDLFCEATARASERLLDLEKILLPDYLV
jgi:hypothetical protein